MVFLGLVALMWRMRMNAVINFHHFNAVHDFCADFGLAFEAAVASTNVVNAILSIAILIKPITIIVKRPFRVIRMSGQNGKTCN